VDVPRAKSVANPSQTGFAAAATRKRPIAFARSKEFSRPRAMRCSSLPLALSSYNPKRELMIMDNYVCQICGYVYEPALGDPDSGIPPGTPFENLPDDWVCPICGASKSDFSKA